MNKLITGLILLFTTSAFAATDRFGNQRNEVPRSSFTNTNDSQVLISTVPVEISSDNVGGGLYLRSMYCSGVDITTVTFYDAQKFTVNVTTRDQFVFVPVNSAGPTSATPSQVNFDAFYSSGLMYTKVGIAPCGIRWDYTTRPKYGDRRN